MASNVIDAQMIPCYPRLSQVEAVGGLRVNRSQANGMWMCVIEGGGGGHVVVSIYI